MWLNIYHRNTKHRTSDYRQHTNNHFCCIFCRRLEIVQVTKYRKLPWKMYFAVTERNKTFFSNVSWLIFGFLFWIIILFSIEILMYSFRWFLQYCTLLRILIMYFIFILSLWLHFCWFIFVITASAHSLSFSNISIDSQYNYLPLPLFALLI